jgi:hypothetical protein
MMLNDSDRNEESPVYLHKTLERALFPCEPEDDIFVKKDYY